MRSDWLAGEINGDATKRLNEVLYDCDPSQAAQAVAEKLNAGVGPQSIWDAIYLTAGEMLMRQPGIISLHAVTMTNALGYAYRRVSSPRLRLKIMLQNASFLALFLDRMQREHVAPTKVREIDALAVGEDTTAEIAAILDNVGQNNPQAARQALGLLNREPAAASTLFHAARRLIFLKGTNSHDYKYSSAVFEDYYAISPAWRNYFAASTLYKLRGMQDQDTQLLPRIRSALA